MRLFKILYPDTAENEYRVNAEIEVNVQPPDYSNDASDLDYAGYTEYRDSWIISVEIMSPVVISSDRTTYKWKLIEINDIPEEERNELLELINKEIMNDCNC